MGEQLADEAGAGDYGGVADFGPRDAEAGEGNQGQAQQGRFGAVQGVRQGGEQGDRRRASADPSPSPGPRWK